MSYTARRNLSCYKFTKQYKSKDKSVKKKRKSKKRVKNITKYKRKQMKGGKPAPLHVASRNGNLEMVKALIENGADVNSRDSSQNTPLHLACENGNLKMVMVLLENGATIDAKNIDKDTPLHFACLNGHTVLAMALIEKGADIYATDNNGSTPYCNEEMIGLFNRLWRTTDLLTAMHSNDMPEFQRLLNDYTYDVNEDVGTNGDGWTILHAAASLNLNMNRMEYVNLLLQSPRINVFAKTKTEGITALHIANSKNDTEFVNAIDVFNQQRERERETDRQRDRERRRRQREKEERERDNQEM